MSYFEHPSDSELTDLDDSDEEVPLAQTRKKKKKPTEVVKFVAIRPFLREANIKQINLESLCKSIKSGTINLNPEYQRDVVWCDEQQSFLIDSLINNCQISCIVFSVKNVNNDIIKTCIDGKQRLTSIYRFMSGEIPRIDPNTKEETWYPTPHLLKHGHPSGRCVKVLDVRAKAIWDEKQLACSEYECLEEGQEREIFRRVQMGVPLTGEERMQALGTWRPGFIHAIRRRTFLPGGFSSTCPDDWSILRGADFSAIAAFVYMIDKHLRGEGKSKEFVPSLANLGPWLQDDSPESRFSRADASKIILAIDIFLNLATSEQHRHVFKLKKSTRHAIASTTATAKPSTFGMKEFGCIGYFIWLWMDKFTMTQMADAVKKVRADVGGIRTAFYERLNKKLTWQPYSKGGSGEGSVASVIGSGRPLVDLEVFVRGGSCSSSSSAISAPVAQESQHAHAPPTPVSTPAPVLAPAQTAAKSSRPNKRKINTLSDSITTSRASTSSIPLEAPKKRGRTSTSTTSTTTAIASVMKGGVASATPSCAPSPRPLTPLISAPLASASAPLSAPPPRSSTTRRSNAIPTKRKTRIESPPESEDEAQSSHGVGVGPGPVNGGASAGIGGGVNREVDVDVASSEDSLFDEPGVFLGTPVKKRAVATPENAKGNGASVTKRATARSPRATKAASATRIKPRSKTAQNKEQPPPTILRARFGAASPTTSISPAAMTIQGISMASGSAAGLRLSDMRIPRHSSAASPSAASSPSPIIPQNVPAKAQMVDRVGTPMMGDNGPGVPATLPARSTGLVKNSSRPSTPQGSTNHGHVPSSVLAAGVLGGSIVSGQGLRCSNSPGSGESGRLEGLRALKARVAAAEIPLGPGTTSCGPSHSTDIQMEAPPVHDPRRPPSSGGDHDVLMLTSFNSRQCDIPTDPRKRLQQLQTSTTPTPTNVHTSLNATAPHFDFTRVYEPTHQATSTMTNQHPAASPASSSRSSTADLTNATLDMIQNNSYFSQKLEPTQQQQQALRASRRNTSLPTPITPSTIASPVQFDAHSPSSQQQFPGNEPPRLQRSREYMTGSNPSGPINTPTPSPTYPPTSQAPRDGVQTPTEPTQQDRHVTAQPRMPSRSESLNSNGGNSGYQGRGELLAKPMAATQIPPMARRSDLYRPPTEEPGRTSRHPQGRYYTNP